MELAYSTLLGSKGVIMTEKLKCSGPCSCKLENHKSKLVVLTGGPGAGKTAILEIAQKSFCEHISILPEAASIVFKGGFWRGESMPARKAAQRAIFHIQKELENIIREEGKVAIALCDRGTVDGMAYWPSDEKSFWTDLNTTKEKEFEKYSAVIHLRTPHIEQGYNHVNPIRIETAKQASEIDEKIAKAWNGHPKRVFIESTDNFIDKIKKSIEIIRNELPDCCKSHVLKV